MTPNREDLMLAALTDEPVAVSKTALGLGLFALLVVGGGVAYTFSKPSVLPMSPAQRVAAGRVGDTATVNGKTFVVAPSGGLVPGPQNQTVLVSGAPLILENDGAINLTQAPPALLTPAGRVGANLVDKIVVLNGTRMVVNGDGSLRSPQAPYGTLNADSNVYPNADGSGVSFGVIPAGTTVSAVMVDTGPRTSTPRMGQNAGGHQWIQVQGGAPKSLVGYIWNDLVAWIVPPSGAVSLPSST